MSSLGRVKTVDRITKPDNAHPNGQHIKGKFISTKTNGHRYESFVIKPENKRVYVHRMVASYFIGNIDKNHEVNHKNGNTKDNRLENLEIITHQENMTHATKVLNKWEKQKTNQNKKVFCIELQKVFDSMKQACEYFGNYKNKGGSISKAIKTGNKIFGVHWKYAE